MPQLKAEIAELKEGIQSKENKANSLRVILEARQLEWERREAFHTALKSEFEQVWCEVIFFCRSVSPVCPG